MKTTINSIADLNQYLTDKINDELTQLEKEAKASRKPKGQKLSQWHCGRIQALNCVLARIGNDELYFKNSDALHDLAGRY